jgi:hypothetical protein
LALNFLTLLGPEGIISFGVWECQRSWANSGEGNPRMIQFWKRGLWINGDFGIGTMEGIM